MCPPALLAIAGTAMSAVGSIQAGNAQAAGYKQQAAQYEAQAALQRRQALLDQISSGQEQRKKQQQIDQIRAQQRNAYGAAGVTQDGSPSDVLIDTTMEGALDVQAIQWNSGISADNSEYAAKVALMNAQGARNAAKTARTTGFLNAFGSVIGGLDNYQRSAGGFKVGQGSTVIGGRFGSN
jgi:hypothetical protein